MYNSFIKHYIIILLSITNYTLYSQPSLITDGTFERFTISTKYSVYSKQTLDDSFQLKNFIYPEVKVENWGLCRYTKSKNIAHSGNVFKILTIFDKVIFEKNIFYYNNSFTQFCKPLIKDNLYEITFYIKPMKGDYFSNKLEVLIIDTLINSLVYREFQGKKINKNTIIVDNKNNFTPCYSRIDIIEDTLNFTKISFKYTALGNEKYIYIGNITSSFPTKYKKVKPFGNQYAKQGLNGRFLIIDDVSLTPIDSNENCFNDNKIEIKLNNQLIDTILIHSEFFKSNESSKKYNFSKITSIKDSCSTIIIIGYTDNIGKETDNKTLALKRAKSYKNFLIKNKIDCKIITKSKGEINNKSHSNNRRIDIFILK